MPPQQPHSRHQQGIALAGVGRFALTVQAHNELWIRAPAGRIFALAAEVERWPEWLPHYRWVEVLERKGNVKLVAMSASRDGIPVSWRAVQVLDPDGPTIRFHHVKGITRGMAVEWSFREQRGGTLVAIDHQLRLRWPLVGDWIAERIIGPYFVEHIAGQTLRRIKHLAEAGA